jgi:hypothetical protein
VDDDVPDGSALAFVLDLAVTAPPDPPTLWAERGAAAAAEE